MLIKNCRIVNSKGIVEGDILIRGEKIADVGRGLKGDGEVLDAKGKVVMPGVVDAHVHVRDFNESKKEDFKSASMAAIAGGVTTFLEMPNTSPEINDLKTLKKRIETGEKSSLIDFGTHLGLPSQIEGLKGLDFPSVKVYMDELGKDVEEVLKRIFSTNLPLSFHCEDPRIIERNLQFSNGGDDFLLHGDVREKIAEVNAVDMVASLALKNKKSAHICHITLPKSVKRLNRFTTCEVTPHHLLLTEKDLRRFKGFAKTNPPLRSKLDVYGLWKAFKEKKIDVIASDHAPHLTEEKERDVLSSPSGIPNLDIMLRLMLDLVSRSSLELSDIARMMCENPARIFKCPGKGFILPGADADLILIDMGSESKIDPTKFYSKAKYSPFEGRKTRGDVETVIMKGNVAFENNQFFVSPGFGKYIYRQL
jgi:dihydroorotase